MISTQNLIAHPLGVTICLHGAPSVWRDLTQKAGVSMVPRVS